MSFSSYLNKMELVSEALDFAAEAKNIMFDARKKYLLKVKDEFSKEFQNFKFAPDTEESIKNRGKFNQLEESFAYASFFFEYKNEEFTGYLSISGYSISAVHTKTRKSTPQSKSLATLKKNLDILLKSL